MLFKVEMTVRLPATMPAAEAEALKKTEREVAQGLMRQGTWRHLWRVAGRYANVSIFDVDSVEHLRDVVEQTKKLGFSVTSAIRIVERIDQEINKALAAISVLSLIVLSISAVGISNTMAASVLERTSEFGIMKSLGARDQHVRLLMLIEGTMTGVVGAFLAWAIAWGLSWGIGTLVRQYLTQRLGESYESNVFLFSPEDFLIVLGVAGVVCVIASILPAHRAARLDPVVAMRRM